jgi:hypothetical protein
MFFDEKYITVSQGNGALSPTYLIRLMRAYCRKRAEKFESLIIKTKQVFIIGPVNALLRRL